MSIVNEIYSKHPFGMIIYNKNGDKWYSIRVFDDTSYWVESNEGDGTQIHNPALFTVIDKLFKKWM